MTVATAAPNTTWPRELHNEQQNTTLQHPRYVGCVFIINTLHFLHACLVLRLMTFQGRGLNKVTVKGPHFGASQVQLRGSEVE